MKIALVASGLAGSSYRGGVILARQIADGLADGHDVHVVEFTHDRRGPATRSGSFSVHHLPAKAMPQGIEPLWAWYPNDADSSLACEFLSTLKPDVVYGHSIYGNTAIYQTATRLGLPIVQHVHDFAFLCGRSFLVDDAGRPCPGQTTRGRCEACLRAEHPPARRLGMRLAAIPGGEAFFRLLLGRSRTERFRLRPGVERLFAFSREYVEAVTTWIATGPRIREVLCRHGVDTRRVTILPHSIPDDRMQRSTPPPPLAGRPVRIGYFGSITPEKGVTLLADAIRELTRQSSRSLEWHVISGAVSAEARRMLRDRSGLSTAQFHVVEGLRGPDLNSVLAQLDLCVIPSLWPEIGPLTLIEALAQGVPCICNDAAGHAHLIQDGVNGFVFRTGDGADLLSKLMCCLANDATLEGLRSHHCPVAPFAEFIGRIEATLASTTNATCRARERTLER